MMTGFKLGLSGKAEAHSSNEGEGHRPNQNTTSARTRATENFVNFGGMVVCKPRITPLAATDSGTTHQNRTKLNLLDNWCDNGAGSGLRLDEPLEFQPQIFLE